MPQHFAAIGFDVSTPEALRELARTAIRHGVAHRTERPNLPEALFVWDAGRGLQVFVAARRSAGGDEEYEIVSCLPGCLPEETLDLRAYRLGRHPTREGEAQLRGRLAGGAEFQAALLDLGLHDALPPAGLERRIRLMGLALQAEAWDPGAPDARVVAVEDPDGTQRTVDSLFIPVDRDGHYQLLGRIERVVPVVNFHTATELVALAVSTSELKLPVIAPASLFERPPAVMQRVEALIWLTAQFGPERQTA